MREVGQERLEDQRLPVGEVTSIPREDERSARARLGRKRSLGLELTTDRVHQLLIEVVPGQNGGTVDHVGDPSYVREAVVGGAQRVRVLAGRLDVCGIRDLGDGGVLAVGEDVDHLGMERPRIGVREVVERDPLGRHEIVEATHARGHEAIHVVRCAEIAEEQQDAAVVRVTKAHGPPFRTHDTPIADGGPGRWASTSATPIRG